MVFMKFKILFNTQKEWAKRVATEVDDFLKSSGHTISENEDIAILIGGDGTIFFYKDNVKGSIFAIGGPQSKVCQANEQNWKEKLDKALKKLKIEERIALSVKINDKDVGWAINDAVVHTRKHRFVEVALKIGRNEYNFGGDGVIVASPTGATGYAYSAGGFIIGKVPNLIEVVAICPHMRAFKPMLVPAAYVVEIMAKGQVDLILDGQKIIELNEGDRVSVCGDKIVKFVDV